MTEVYKSSELKLYEPFNTDFPSRTRGDRFQISPVQEDTHILTYGGRMDFYSTVVGQYNFHYDFDSEANEKVGSFVVDDLVIKPNNDVSCPFISVLADTHLQIGQQSGDGGTGSLMLLSNNVRVANPAFTQSGLTESAFEALEGNGDGSAYVDNLYSYLTNMNSESNKIGSMELNGTLTGLDVTGALNEIVGLYSTLETSHNTLEAAHTSLQNEYNDLLNRFNAVFGEEAN